MRDLGGKVAVVTGGASGIGRALAQRFTEEGAHVVIADVEQAALDATAAELGVTGVVCDVSDAASVAALRQATLDRFGAVHIVCLNAGVGGGGLIADCTLKDWQWVLGVNLWGVVYGIDAFLHDLLDQGEGHIVMTASLAGLMAAPGIGPYNASKYAVVGIAETLRAELAGTGVGVSVLCPGFVRTNIFTSQRNRPAELTNADRKPLATRDANEDRIETVLREAMSPSDVADRVLAAVRDERFWIITHPEILDPYATKTAEVLATRETP
jgi:NAD(P)-dependent dehydrogenase (short-subunit alcohol dehydrogenase family)